MVGTGIFSLFSFSSPKTLVLQHLTKDCKGKRKIHESSCTLFGIKHLWVCSCPATLAAGTGDNIFGKLRSPFSEMGKGGDWNVSSGTGIPASHYIVRQYLLHLREEQAKTRVSPKQAVLFFNELKVMLVLLFERADVFRPTFPFPAISLCHRFCLLFSGGIRRW